MKQLVSLLLGCIACVLFACDYSPSGAHFKAINPDVPVVADISLNQQQDTIVVRGNMTLNYTISLPGRLLYGYQLKLDDVLLEQGNTLNGSHLFIPGKYDDGYHLLKLEILSTSGTGSLADKSGAERLEIYRTWVLYIDNSPPKPVAITSIKPEDGRLKLEWQKTDRTGFRMYNVMKSSNISNSSGAAEVVVASITLPDITTWEDPNYVGGPVTYRIVVRSDYQPHADGVVGPTRSYNYPAPKVLESTYNKANELTIKFSSTPFFRNFSRYIMSISEVPTNRVFYSIALNKINDTVATIPVAILGVDFDVTLNTEPVSTGPAGHHYVSTTKTRVDRIGTPWGPYHNLKRRSLANLFYQLSPNEFKLIDGGTLQEKQSRTFTSDQAYASVALSEDTRHMYAISKSGDIHKLNSGAFQSIGTYKLTDLLPRESYSNVSLQGVSNNNRLLVFAKDWEQNNVLVLVDMEARKVLLERYIYQVYVNNYQVKTHVVLHPAGNAIVNGYDIMVEQSNGSWKHGSLPGSWLTDIKFHPTEPWAYGMQNGQLNFYNIETAALVKTILPEYELVSYEMDAASGFLYGYTRSMALFDPYYFFYVYDTRTGQLKRKLQVRETGVAFVFNDKIFTSDRYIPL